MLLYLEAVWRFNDRTKSRTLPNSEAMWDEAEIRATWRFRGICPWKMPLAKSIGSKYNSDM